jgi:tRNA pseudouridine55 synthase
MYSAVKVGGRKLYELARQGKEVARVARSIVVSELVVEAIALPTLTLRIACSKGTYVRVLAEDLGERLGCGAHLTALRRLSSGPFDLKSAVPLDDLLRAEPEERAALVAKALVPMAQALGETARVVLEPGEVSTLLTSGRLPLRELTAPAGLAAIVDSDGDLLALADSDGAALRIRRVLPR